MKGQLSVILTLAGLVLAEPPAPYAASGWKPNGPAFDLPQRVATQYNDQQSYLPPLEPRNPQNQYGIPDDDDTVTVQGLPVKEQVPIFTLSPVNGQQYVGPNYNIDVKNLDDRLKQQQFQTQQEIFRQILRERELYAAQNQQNNFNSIPNQQEPRQFTNRPTNTEATTFASTPNNLEETVTESTKNEEPKGPSQTGKEKENILSVEITKERLRELPIIFLGPVAQNGQIRQPNNLQFAKLTQPQIARMFGYDGPAHLAGLQSILSQNQFERQQAVPHVQEVDDGLVEQITPVTRNEQPNLSTLVPQQMNPVQPVLVQYQPQGQFGQPQAFQPAQFSPSTVGNVDGKQVQTVYNPAAPVLVQYQPQGAQFAQPQSFQPAQFAQPQAFQPAQFGQSQAFQPTQFGQQQAFQPARLDQQQLFQPAQFSQPQILQQAQYGQPQQNENNDDERNVNQQQFISNPQDAYQRQFFQQQNQQFYYNEESQPQFYQNQAQGQVYQDRNALQSGLDMKPQGNGIEDKDDDEEDKDTTATAVATAFGTRTSPRVIAQYGVPISRPTPNDVQEPVTESLDSSTEEPEGPAVATATAVAKGGRRRNSKLRIRRLRPVFTLDKSGHLVLLNNNE